MKIFVVKFPEGLSGHDGALVAATDADTARGILGNYIYRSNDPVWGLAQDVTVKDIGSTDLPEGIIHILYDIGYGS